MAETNSQISAVEGKLGSKVIETLQPQGDDVLILDRSDLRESFRILKEDPELDFTFLSDITAVDYWHKKEPRFEVVYQILSRAKRRRLRIRVPVPENDPAVESLTPLWRGANFMEREVWASVLSIIRICGAFFCTMNLKVIRCAKTTRST
jgi:NADH-quinone oxidoreductase subunit C